jgi:hypothetical protein
MLAMSAAMMGLLLAAAASSGAAQDYAELSSIDCPPWYLRSPDTGPDYLPKCYCADTLKNIVQCNSRNLSSSIALNYCMTYDNSTGMVLVGACPYTRITENIMGIWTLLPSNVSKIAEHSCTPLNREGLLCGKCKDGYGISVRLADSGCVKCSDHPHGWTWLIFTQIPLQTLFFLIIFFFNISLTTPKLNGFLLACQIGASTRIDQVLPQYLNAIGYHGLGKLSTAMFVFCKFWVLDFFTSVLPEACFHEKMNMLQAVALWYLPAFYPFLFILGVFILVRITDCNFKLVSLLLAPCKTLKVKASKYINLQQSLIHTFSGVIILSYSKFTLVSYSLLFPTALYNASGDLVHKGRWYYDAEIEVFGSEHILYGIMAIIILMLFVVAPPLLLLLYPFRWFRWVLHKTRLDYPGLDAFMDSFQGYYRDGTMNSRDLRYFAALYFIVRLLFISARLFTLYRLQFYIILLIFISAAIIFSFAHPYKRNIHNIVDLCFLCYLSSMFFIYVVFTSLDMSHSEMGVMMGLLSTVPFLYFVILMVLELVISVKAIRRGIKNCLDYLYKRLLTRKELRSDMLPFAEWPHRLLESEYVSSYSYEDKD